MNLICADINIPTRLDIYLIKKSIRMVKGFSLLFLSLSLLLVAQASIYDQYYEDCKKIAQAMTLEQKIGQTIQLTFEGVTEK